MASKTFIKAAQEDLKAANEAQDTERAKVIFEAIQLALVGESDRTCSEISGYAPAKLWKYRR